MNITVATKMVESEIMANKPDCALYTDATSEYSKCFVFYYQSKKYIETANFEDMYDGHGPIIVCKNTGKIFETGSAFPTEYYVASFESCGDPFGEPTNKVEINGYIKNAIRIEAIKLVKAKTDLDITNVKKIIDSIFANEKAIFATGSKNDAKETVEKLNEFGFTSKQLWKPPETSIEL